MKRKKTKTPKERAERIGLIVNIMSGNVKLRSYSFNDEYNAEIFVRMFNSKRR